MYNFIIPCSPSNVIVPKYCHVGASLIFSYISPCKLYINGDNNPQVLIYMPVTMPFYKPDRAYTANSTSQGYILCEHCLISNVTH